MKIKKQQINKGFTLIELMVATSIFVVIMLSSMSSLFIMLDATKSSKALRFAMDNVNFAMESMTRSIRMGKNYYCVEAGDTMPSEIDVSNDCLEGGTLLSFVPQESASRVGYKIASVAGSDYHTIERCDTYGCVPIISPNVDIDRLKFFVRGSADDDIQASVYVIIKGTVMVKGAPTSFAIQTMASQRNF
jgi:prepilin-type N-terminal cleavage/methylation domain-containing protein